MSDTTGILLFQREQVHSVVDTIVQPASLGSVEVIDFDADGDSDILLSYIGNVPDYTLYLYDSATYLFKFIDGYNRFPDSQKLDVDSDLYYSYQRAGCADLNWVSDLFMIRNFRIQHLANLYAEGCEHELQQISVYRVLNNSRDHLEQVETLPYSTEQNDLKDTLIRKYWTANSAKFLQEVK